MVSGGGCDAVAAWRGAFLAHGSLTEPGRSSSLEITCPGPEAALAIVGVARRLGISAKAREVRGVDRVVIRDGDAIGALLTRLGAHESLMAWEERRMRREVRRPRTGSPTSTTPTCAARPAPRSPPAPASSGPWRSSPTRSPTTSSSPATCGSSTSRPRLEELGQLHDPVLTKDAIAGRIRRLLAMADKRAEELGIPDTESSADAEMLADERRAESAARRGVATLLAGRVVGHWPPDRGPGANVPRPDRYPPYANGTRGAPARSPPTCACVPSCHLTQPRPFRGEPQ